MLHRRRIKLLEPVTFQQFEQLVEQAHGHSKYAKALWGRGFIEQIPNPKIMDIPSPVWCFIAFEKDIAVLNHLTANHLYGKINNQVTKTLN
jgi:hypothetical protein